MYYQLVSYPTAQENRGSGCYICDGELKIGRIHSKATVNNTNTATNTTPTCCTCNRRLQHGKDSIVLAKHPNNRQQFVCLYCYDRQQVGLGSISNTKLGHCWVCGVISNACEYLSITLGEKHRVVYTACSNEHFEYLLTRLSKKRTGWCRNCDAFHFITGPSSIKMHVRRLRIINKSQWLSWRTWLNLFCIIPDTYIEEYTQHIH